MINMFLELCENFGDYSSCINGSLFEKPFCNEHLNPYILLDLRNLIWCALQFNCLFESDLHDRDQAAVSNANCDKLVPEVINI